ncbi:DUF4340 domain-containing protein [Bdellovibrio reynosensis]|uniref:DUF4340 domain-containing protein n=1 Tax=Bdellovibrio reynosensis TaxID=2835041 RepID=A0ABY4CCX0_9BACT|nr:DUF4340 domain-containing protein [Bdellovibrio reynosensis]UOF02813.1 DUF4340 domain-containing protein [Bdellovibrio reynosensis]
MKLKGRSILVFCLLLFGGYAYWDFLRDEKKAEKTQQANRLMTVDFQQVDSVQLKKDDQEVSLKRTVDGWEIVSPIKDLADNTVVDDFVKNIFPESVIEVAKEGDGIDWAVYGLDKPLGTITLTTSAGAKNTFEISEKRNFEENAFLRKDGENRVLVVNSVWQSRIQKSVLDFRDRRLLRKKIASIDEVRIENAKGALEIKRVDGKWISPVKKDLALDQNKVRALLTSIADAKGKEIFEGGAQIPPGKKLFGLKLVMADEKWQAQVTQAKDLGIYAVPSSGLSMKLEPGALDGLINMTVEDLKEQPADKKDPLEKNSKPVEDSDQAMIVHQKEIQ